MEKEIWKESAVFGEQYFVSNTGKIKSKDERILKPYLAKNGYYFITLYFESNKRTLLVHRVLALTFLPNPENKQMVNHIDGCKTNNNLSNLEWCTPKENSQHAWAAGLMENSRQKAAIRMSNIGLKYKEQNGQRLKDLNKIASKRIEIYDLNWVKIAEYESIKDLRRRTGIGGRTIKSCISRSVPHKRKNIYFKIIS
jgi:hypothetical protein